MLSTWCQQCLRNHDCKHCGFKSCVVFKAWTSRVDPLSSAGAGCCCYHIISWLSISYYTAALATQELNAKLTSSALKQQITTSTTHVTNDKAHIVLVNRGATWHFLGVMVGCLWTSLSNVCSVPGCSWWAKMLTHIAFKIHHMLMLTDFTQTPFVTPHAISCRRPAMQVTGQNNSLNTVNSSTPTASCQKKRNSATLVFGISADRISLLNREGKTVLFSLAGVPPHR